VLVGDLPASPEWLRALKHSFIRNWAIDLMVRGLESAAPAGGMWQSTASKSVKLIKHMSIAIQVSIKRSRRLDGKKEELPHYGASEERIRTEVLAV
jgi:hypothetical protein